VKQGPKTRELFDPTRAIAILLINSHVPGQRHDFSYCGATGPLVALHSKASDQLRFGSPLTPNAAATLLRRSANES